MHTKRESWLMAAVELSRPMFEQAGSPLPATVRAAVGLTKGKKSIGECWSDKASDDGVREIWIKPYTREPLEILGVLVHELCHAALPHEVTHTKPFVTLARKMHLEGKPTATVIGEAFRGVWEPLLAQLGPYPGGVLNAAGGAGKEKKSAKPSHIKIACDCCELSFWMTPKLLEQVSAFQCIDPECDGAPQPEEK